MKRLPAVAGRFYPSDPQTLVRQVSDFCATAGPKREALMVVSPHAGYPYSGGVAGETLAGVTIPRDVLLMGPNHHGRGASVALMDRGVWAMPMGDVSINEELAGELARSSPLVKVDAEAHRFEHSLEVQVPFLQFLRPDVMLTPLVVSQLPYSTCLEFGRQLAAVIKGFGEPVLILASSDMTHYESRQSATAKDRLAIEHILALDPAGLYKTVLGQRISMCGIMPATVALLAAIELGAKKAELVRYTDSGVMTGDTGQVVGYAGLVIS